MAQVIAGMTTSLDGFVADDEGNADRVNPDLASLQGSTFMNDLIDETGAVLMGRATFDMADDPDSWVETYEFQRPIFVVTHHPPSVAPKQDEHLTFIFVTDGVESAVGQATAAAGDRAVSVVGGVSLTRQLLQAGLVDELHVDVMPVLLGSGLRLFEDVGADIALEKIGVVDVGVTGSAAPKRINLRAYCILLAQTGGRQPVLLSQVQELGNVADTPRDSRPSLRLGTVCLDCADADAMADFYGRLLGWDATSREPGWVLMRDPAGGTGLSFQAEDGYRPPVWPERPDGQDKMLHLDIEVDDLDAAVTHALASGARLAEHQPQARVRVLLDPAGHPFCLFLD